MTKLEDEKNVLKTIFEEIVDTVGDSYPNKQERQMVTNAMKLKAIGIGEPRPYGVPPKPRSWDAMVVSSLAKVRADPKKVRLGG